jgi:hypothetical protein
MTMVALSLVTSFSRTFSAGLPPHASQSREERAESRGVVTAWGARREGKGGRQLFMVCLVTARYCNSYLYIPDFSGIAIV